MEDTIAAISTALGVGAISIIRVSGKDALDIVNKIVKKKNVNNMRDHSINYAHIVDGDRIVDEVMISVMHAPNTYTKEDVVEINSHGGIASTNKILNLLLKNGCRLAHPGEFTSRAFLNGRIDLLKAESIMDIINAKTEKSLTLAVNQLGGNISDRINEVRSDLSKIITNIEVNIDYPEYEDIEVLTNDKILPELNKVKCSLNKLIVNAKDSKIIKEGINTVIIGRPNVGKSSILNSLLNEEKAIVTDIPGTTRDIVEGIIDINGIRLNIIDTAGIRETTDVVESIGVKKSLSLIEKADLVIFVLNNNEKMTNEEVDLLGKIKNKNHIVVINKNDLDKKIDVNIENAVYLSAINKEGIEDLKSKIIDIFNLENIEASDLNYLSSARSISLIEQSLEKVESAIGAINNNLPIDIVEIDIKESWIKLGDILGVNYQEDLINELFSNFCLGK